MSEIDLQRIWAKTSKETEEVHSLLYHMLDVGETTLAVWDSALPDSTRASFASALGCSKAEARSWLGFLTALHDLGKASPVFQRKHGPSRALLESELRFEKYFTNISAPHGWITAWSLLRLLPSELGMGKELSWRVAQCLGGHHGDYPNEGDLDHLGPSRRGNAGWDEVRLSLFMAISQELMPEVRLAWPDALLDDQAFWVMFSGLTSFADWIGSDERFFFDLSAPDLTEYATLAYGQAQEALKHLGWRDWFPPEGVLGFYDLFRKRPRPMQESVVSLSAHLQSPAIVIIEAPTGEGKTEAALYLANHWLHQERQQGLYVAMPTQATSNQMLGRVRGMLGACYSGEGQVDLHLVHGNAAFSKEMKKLRLAAGDPDNDDTVISHTWFLPKKGAMLAPFAVGTIDQALMGVLQTRHFFVRLFGLGHRTVVFDEVHAYDTYTSTLLEHLLSWLAALDTTVVLLSATLPASTRMRLISAYTGRPIEDDVCYPAITWATADRQGVVPVETSPVGRRTVRLEWIGGAADSIAATLKKELDNGGCAAVICNTVGRSQEVYEALKQDEFLSSQDLMLFHARFPFNLREGIERDVLARFSGERSKGETAIVVATQVIEQSLDLDFDLMITEVAPVDLVLQRMGRLFRHKREWRPDGLKEPRLLIAEPEMSQGLPQWGASSFIYEPYVLLRSYLELCSRPSIQVPEEVQALIEGVYSDNASTSDLQEPLVAELTSARKAMLANRRKDAFKAMGNLIPSPDRDLLDCDSARLDEDDPRVHHTLRALTRLARPSVNLVCLHKVGEGVYLDPEGEEPVNLEEPPKGDMTARLVGHSIKVSHYQVFKHFVEEKPPRAWKRNSALRYYRAAVFSAGRCAAGETLLLLDPELGLMVQKEETDDVILQSD